MTIKKIVARPVAASGPVSTGAEIAAAVNAIIDAYHAFKDVGWSILDSFEAGATVNLRNELLRWGSTGGLYRWDGALPKVVTSGGTPVSRGGVGSGAWVIVDLNGDSIANEIFGKATLDLQFGKNIHKVYEPFGLTNKTLTEAVTTARNSTATYDSPVGIATSAVNIPRIEYGTATGDALGLLVEEQRTNLLVRSQEFDNASWSQSPNADVDVTANATVAPDGTTTADKFFEATTANTYHDLFQSLTFVSATIYTASAFVKASERSRGVLVFGANAGFTSERAVHFNLVAKTASAIGTGVTVGIEEYPNGWFRVWVSATADASGVSPVYLRLQDNSGVSIYAGTVNSGLFIWGAQVEAGSFPTSYIPTTTAQVTRVADVINRVLPAVSEGTLFAVASGPAPVNGVNQAIFTLSDGTAANRVLIRRNNSNAGSGFVVASGNVVQTTGNSTAKPAGQRDKYAISWKRDSFIFVENGVAVFNGTSGAVPINATQLGIGSAGVAFAGAESLNGTIERLVFIPRALTLAELQAITT